MIHLRGHVFGFAAILAAFILAVLFADLFRQWRRMPKPAALPPCEAVFDPAAPEAPLFSLSDASLVRPAGGIDAAAAREAFFTQIEKRFRLAGFRISKRTPSSSSAIVEDMETHDQWMRKKGDRLSSDILVSGVHTNFLLLETPYGQYRLFQSARERKGSTARPSDGQARAQSFAAGAISRLEGRETSPGTWQFSRADVMDYFNEVKDRPERFEALFDTLAPIWYTDEEDGRRKIEGYRVEICGEEDFFRAVGFKEGDIVREVNGIQMTNRYAAEELIRRFVNDDLSFAHIKMERNGEEIVQSYLLGE